MEEDRQYKKGLWFAYFYLKYRLRTEKEIRDYLHKKAPKHVFDEDTINKVIAKLKNQHFVDDQKFIEWYVDNKLRTKPRSVFMLKQELRRLGVDNAIVDHYFMDAEVDEEETALDLLQRKWRSYQRLEPQKQFQRAAGFLMRKGYSYDIVKRTIDKLTK